ncbi:MAG TPA: carotenoid biosynthesis protein [Geobacteraceae bacterium]|nr:carotenoid biosynthesis protein [Geobacteraceae bacterium]
MSEFLRLLAGTVTMRPYVFAFLAVYLVTAILHLGWRKTVIFTVIGYLIAFVSEYSSVHNGFPYGWYYYTETTRQKELFVAGVPFFDSLSYVFMAYCSYTTALLVVSPIKTWRWDFMTLETRRIRKSLSVLFLGSLLQVFLDIVVDPVALQGHRWFLGQIYGYREAGVHFGVPLSNYLGWWLVSAALVLAVQIIDTVVGRKSRIPSGMKKLPFRSLLGPFLYLSVLVFNLTITYMIGEKLLALTGLLIFILPISISVVLLKRRANRYAREELSEHLSDFPHSPVSGIKLQS